VWGRVVFLGRDRGRSQSKRGKGCGGGGSDWQAAETDRDLLDWSDCSDCACVFGGGGAAAEQQTDQTVYFERWSLVFALLALRYIPFDTGDLATALESLLLPLGQSTPPNRTVSV